MGRLVTSVALIIFITHPLIADEIDDLGIFNRIQVGMTSEEVEASCGESAVAVGKSIYYGGQPVIGIYQSPISPYRVVVEIEKDVVVTVKFFSDMQRFSLIKTFDKGLYQRALKSLSKTEQ